MRLRISQRHAVAVASTGAVAEARAVVLAPRGDLPIPLAWLVVAVEYWHCPETATRKAWYALAASGSARVIAFRQRWLLMPAIGRAEDALRTQALSPQVVIDVLEQCCEEGTLARSVAVVLEAAILQAVDRDGQWKRRD